MAYELYYSSGTGTLTVSDNAANTQTMLVLPGKDYVGYGSPVDQNQLSMLENYASYTTNTDSRATLDSKAIRGQIIFDTVGNQVKVNTSASPGFPNWVTLQSGSVSIATTSSLGIIKVGSGLSIAVDGTLSATGGGGSGSVTSVGLSMPSGFSVSGSPITSAGSFTVSTALNGIVAANGSGFTTITVGSGLTYSGTTLSGTPAGSSTQLQYNNAGSFGGITGVTSNGSNISFASTSNISIGGGSSGQVLSTNGSGVLSWIAQGGGSTGYQSASAVIYKWAATQPTLPDQAATYTWSSGVISAIPSGWSESAPATPPNPGDSLWADTVRIIDATSATSTTFNWNTGAITQVSAPGEQGLMYSTVYLYQWAPTQPGNPSGVTTFTWASSSNAGYTGGNGWSVDVPSNPGTSLLYLWTASKTISAAGGTTNTVVDWSTGYTVSALSQNGAQGDTGAAGPKIANASVFKWSLPPAPAISGTSTYTWSDGSISSPPSGWQSTSGASTPGYYLYEARVQVTAASTATTSTVDWGSASILIVGYAGDNGTGSIQSRIGYARISGLASPIANQITVSGDNLPTQSESANTSTGWGLNYAWATTDPNPLSTTESLYVIAGIYNGTNTVWDTPYLSSLRVGQLSAITANMGSITAGSLNINDKFIVGVDGTTTIKTNASGTTSQMIISNNAIKVYDESGNLRVQIGNLAA